MWGLWVGLNLVWESRGLDVVRRRDSKRLMSVGLRHTSEYVRLVGSTHSCTIVGYMSAIGSGSYTSACRREFV